MNTYYSLRKRVFDPLAWILSRNELHKLIREANDDIDNIVDIMEKYTGRGYYARIHAYQRRIEIIELVRLLQQIRPKTIVEIGTDDGGTFFLWCRSIAELEYIASIDLAGGRFGGGYDIKRIKLYRDFLYDKPKAQTLFLRSDSHASSTTAQLTNWLDSRPIDFLFIDGDHTYAGVKQDFEMYAGLVRPGGIIAFHDIVTTGKGHEVYKFWNEIKTHYQYQEIIENPTGPMGIGVIQVSNE